MRKKKKSPKLYIIFGTFSEYHVSEGLNYNRHINVLIFLRFLPDVVTILRCQ